MNILSNSPHKRSISSSSCWSKSSSSSFSNNLSNSLEISLCLSCNSSAITPGGIRIGTPALTTRGFTEKDFIKVTDFLDRAILIGLEIQNNSGNKLQDFINSLPNNEKLILLKNEINQFAEKFEFYDI